MNKEEKSKLYLELVDEVKKTYLSLEEFESQNYGGVFLTTHCVHCEEINLYTYWQGINYAKKTPVIKYLLVGQDFGGYPAGKTQRDKDKAVFSAMKKDENLPCHAKFNPKSISTDDNLMQLFSVLGYKHIDEQRYNDLFFTNFCLGYRTGNTSGGMTKEFMMHDADYFKRLCDILEPDNILCLGKLTFECVFESLKGKDESKPAGFSDSYNKFIEKYGKTPITATVGDNHEVKIFPLAHPGFYGTKNRCGKKGTPEKGLELQKKDWKKILAAQTTG